MVSKGLTTLVAAAALALSLVSTEQALAKPHKAQSRARGNYFVPPPPPYAPSILPERFRSGAGTTVASADVDEAEVPVKPENPYRKYIFTPNENDTPHVVQPNRYVTYWNSKSKTR